MLWKHNHVKQKAPQNAGLVGMIINIQYPVFYYATFAAFIFFLKYTLFALPKYFVMVSLAIR